MVTQFDRCLFAARRGRRLTWRAPLRTTAPLPSSVVRRRCSTSLVYCHLSNRVVPSLVARRGDDGWCLCAGSDMYAHGLGLSRDYHLAKRHYDIALETAVEAWAPVHLALLELNALQWWEARTGGSVGDPYEYAFHMIAPARGLFAPAAVLEHDTLLIVVLSAALGVVLVVRQRRQLHP